MNTMNKLFIATIATLVAACGPQTTSSMKDTFDPNEITLDEARTFLKVHVPKAFPGSDVTNVSRVKVDTYNAQKIICYGVECWPVRKERGEIIDLATEIATGLGTVRVEFSQINQEHSTSLKKSLQEKVFALTLTNTDYIANVLRFLDGYSYYASYSVKFIPKNTADALPSYKWGDFQYFSDGAWHENSQISASFENIGRLEEIYDGSLAILGSVTPETIQTSGYWHGEFAEISPWSQTIDAVVKDGDIIANLSEVNLLPEGPRLFKTQWIYPTVPLGSGSMNPHR